MTNDIVSFMLGFFREIWRLFNSWEFPGLGFTPAQFYFFILLLPIILKVIKSIVMLSIEQMNFNSREKKSK